MNPALSVIFFGTSSGGGPSASRNCSSLIADVLGNGNLWMVDCAEGTIRQFANQPWTYGQQNPRPTQVKKIFITHMHADHVMGIIPMLRNVLFAPSTDPQSSSSSANKSPSIEIYGPAGIRTFVRSVLKMTLTRTADNYVVHELLTPEDEPTLCDPAEVMHYNEVPGRDILCSPEDGFWRGITQEKGAFCDVVVDAGSILHRDPCLGYVFRECAPLSRKLVFLGDTYDASPIIPLCLDPSPSLVVHEATEAHIPQEIDPKSKRSLETVKQKAFARGHSIPEQAGGFAKAVGAQQLVLNHIGSRFPHPSPTDTKGIRASVLREMERQASVAWGMGNVRVAFDFMHVSVPLPSDRRDDVSDSPPGWQDFEDFPTMTHQNPYYGGGHGRHNEHIGSRSYARGARGNSYYHRARHDSGRRQYSTNTHVLHTEEHNERPNADRSKRGRGIHHSSRGGVDDDNRGRGGSSRKRRR
ncbi:hypothetical protein Moror_11829 [Moniliophthora roreri MCA 2997]|nr:hypothetical protein Moror_11829 [Moniliophthora roreri MCA 2997]